MRRLIIWGCGELGARVGKLWEGKVLGFTQTNQKHQNLITLNIEPYIGSPIKIIKPEDNLLIALPGHQNQSKALQFLIENKVQPARRSILISSTGFYGNQTGKIDENTPHGTTDRAKAIAQLESDFLSWAGKSAIIIRFAGLYRPGRGPFSFFSKHQKAPSENLDQTLGLIHYEDAAQATVKALKLKNPKSVYLGLTNPSPTRFEFYKAACEKLEIDNDKFSGSSPTPSRWYNNSLFVKELLSNSSYADWHAALE